MWFELRNAALMLMELTLETTRGLVAEVVLVTVLRLIWRGVRGAGMALLARLLRVGVARVNDLVLVLWVKAVVGLRLLRDRDALPLRVRKHGNRILRRMEAPSLGLGYSFA